MSELSEEPAPDDVNYEEQYGILSEENKKLKIDISSLQLSNRSLVNQNRDEKKKVMDCRLQIADLEGRLKAFETTKQELAESQGQCERIRMTLESNEAKLADAERRADEATGLVKIKDSIIVKQSNFTKEIEERLRNVTDEKDHLLNKCSNLESELNVAVIRGEDADDLREKLKALQELFDNLVNERGDTTSESSLAAANDYFKSEQAKCEHRISELKNTKSELEHKVEELENDKKVMQDEMNRQLEDYDKLGEKCATLEARIKEMAHSERRYGAGMIGSRLIGPTLPPWIADEKKLENDLERLSKTDPATLRAKVMELESQVNELNQLLTYREDVILRIHEEISKKASKLEAADVERSSLNAQISILKRELANAREDLARRGVGPADLEAEIERLRGKRDREYQRRKRIEADLDQFEKDNQELRQRIKRLEEVAVSAPPKPLVPQSDPSDRARIMELQNTVNQLRMDNEAKRSELFDLRARFDSKSAHVDKMSAEFKTKERSCSELTTQLNSVRSQLETTTKELESVRCRAVRGGAEVERWHSDLLSLQITNKFLSSQLNELRDKIISKDHMIAQLTKRCQESLTMEPVKDDVTEEAAITLCSRCGGASVEEIIQEREIAELESKLKESERRCTVLLEEATQARECASGAKNQVETLTVQVVELQNSLTQAKTDLQEMQSNHNMTESDGQSSPNLISKKSKQNAIASSDNEECSNCIELKRRMSDMESTSVSRESDLTNKVKTLETQVVELQNSLTQAKTDLQEIQSNHNMTESDGQSSPNLISKETNQNAVASNDAEECSSCIELKKRVKDMESTSFSRESDLTNKVEEVTSQVIELENNLLQTRTQLLEAQSTLRKVEAEAHTPVISPPAKRTRRSAGANAKVNSVNSQDCSSCTELRKQVQELESNITEYSLRESALINKVNHLREEGVRSDKTTLELRSQLSSIHNDLSN